MKARSRKPREPTCRIEPSVRTLAIERDRWVGYPAGNAGLSRLAQLHATRARIRMPCLLLYGVSGAGKSMLLAKFQRDHTPNDTKRVGLQSIIATQMPPVPVIRSLYAEIVRSINIHARPSLRLHELENTARLKCSLTPLRAC